MAEPSDELRLGVAGALGRMGQAVLAVAAEEAGLTVAAAFDRPGTAGQLTGETVLLGAEEALAGCDVIVDFSTAAASAALAAEAAGRGGPALIIGSTGATSAEEAAIADAARKIAIVRSGNFSLGINLLAALVEEAARRLPAETWDIEILETHHRRKADAPSGTALMLGAAAAAGRAADLSEAATRARDGITGPRNTGEIGFAALRAGGVVGEHSVILASEDEILTLSHSARDRRLFARGAIAAARWVKGRPRGLYEMRDVLGFVPGGAN